MTSLPVFRETFGYPTLLCRAPPGRVIFAFVTSTIRIYASLFNGFRLADVTKRRGHLNFFYFF